MPQDHSLSHPRCAPGLDEGHVSPFAGVFTGALVGGVVAGVAGVAVASLVWSAQPFHDLQAAYVALALAALITIPGAIFGCYVGLQRARASRPLRGTLVGAIVWCLGIPLVLWVALSGETGLVLGLTATIGLLGIYAAGRTA